MKDIKNNNSNVLTTLRHPSSVSQHSDRKRSLFKEDLSIYIVKLMYLTNFFVDLSLNVNLSELHKNMKCFEEPQTRQIKNNLSRSEEQEFFSWVYCSANIYSAYNKEGSSSAGTSAERKRNKRCSLNPEKWMACVIA